MITPKRIFDIAVSGAALLLFAPIMGLISVAILLESNGPIFYAATRAGMGFQRFKLYKFRTMYAGSDKKLKDLASLNIYAQQPTPEGSLQECGDCLSLGQPCSPLLITTDGKIVCERLLMLQKTSADAGTFYKFKNDPRITRIGRFLRNTSLDELPQFINVFFGDMSLVGNRPLPLYEAEKLTTDQAALRFAAPAGITGLWQVTKRSKGGAMSDAERIALDNMYALHNSLFFDIKLMMKTVPALFQSENV